MEIHGVTSLHCSRSLPNPAWARPFRSRDPLQAAVAAAQRLLEAAGEIASQVYCNTFMFYDAQ